MSPNAPEFSFEKVDPAAQPFDLGLGLRSSFLHFSRESKKQLPLGIGQALATSAGWGGGHGCFSVLE